MPPSYEIIHIHEVAKQKNQVKHLRINKHEQVT